MDAIKKKMQAMKLENDKAMHRDDDSEQQAKDANLRAERVSHFSSIKSTFQFNLEVQQSRILLLKTAG